MNEHNKSLKELQSRRNFLKEARNVVVAGGLLSLLNACASMKPSSPPATPAPLQPSPQPDPHHLLKNPYNNPVLEHPDVTVIFLGDWKRGKLGDVQDILMKTLRSYVESSVYQELNQYGVGTARINDPVMIEQFPEAFKKPPMTSNSTMYDVLAGSFPQAVAQLLEEKVSQNILNPNHQFLFVLPPEIQADGEGGYHANTINVQPSTNIPYSMIRFPRNKVPETEQDVYLLFNTLQGTLQEQRSSDPLGYVATHELVEMFSDPYMRYDPDPKNSLHIDERSLAWNSGSPNFLEVGDLAEERVCYVQEGDIPVLVAAVYSNARGGIYPALDNTNVSPAPPEHSRPNISFSTIQDVDNHHQPQPGLHNMPSAARNLSSMHILS